jgi:hypothetical protein
MTPKEFTIWLKGFAKAANAYNITPAQWETIVEELDNIIDEPIYYNQKDVYPTPHFHIEPIKPGPVWCATTTDDKTILND